MEISSQIKQQKKQNVKRRKFKKLKGKIENKPQNRSNRKLNVYHVLRMFKKYSPLDLKKIILDPHGIKNKVTICVAESQQTEAEQSFENVFLDEQPMFSDKIILPINVIQENYFDNCYLYNDLSEFYFTQKIRHLTISEADNLLHQKNVEKNCVLRSQKRLKAQKHFKCMNIFEKKIVSFSSKMYNKLKAVRRLNDLKQRNKDRKGGTRYRNEDEISDF
ncbi:hypothetical protein M153_2100024447 [Pseudoloma neurophilia]|uniref:Uncharacterized protein n=1 Tax=Pseudoloma neurophilia TaxID=146866 RepID=A0A0R0M6M4_9MICR|nr:hypothetical protein M153_2100024447 [Pseudoloma neurophilia]